MELTKEQKALILMGLQLLASNGLAENKKQMVRNILDLSEMIEADLKKILEEESADKE